MSTGAIIAVGAVGVMVCCSASSAAAVMMGGDDDKTPGPGPAPAPGPGPGPGPAPAPCAGLTDTSLASSIPVSCLRKLLTDEGCTSNGTIWPDDDYDGWWRQSPQGTTTVWCNDQGTPCGAGNYAQVKSDIKAWATMTDDLRVKGCGRA